jgi:protease I
MSRIAALIADLFEDVEYLQPAAEFRKAGHRVENIGLAGVDMVKGLDSQTVQVDRDIKDVVSNDYDVLFIPGGYSPDKLREDENIIYLVRNFLNLGKPVFVVGHGLQLLISACLLAGRKVAARKSLAQDTANAGGILSELKVMVDSNLITCSNDNELPTFIIACLQKLSA